MYTFATAACLSNKGPMNIGPVSLFRSLRRTAPVDGCLPYENFPSAADAENVRLLARSDSTTNGGKVYESNGTSWVLDATAPEGSLAYSLADEAYFWLFPSLGCCSMLCRHVTAVDEVRPDPATPVVAQAIGTRILMDTSDAKFCGWLYTRRNLTESWNPTTGTTHASNYAALLNPFCFLEHGGEVLVFAGDNSGGAFEHFASLADVPFATYDAPICGRAFMLAVTVISGVRDTTAEVTALGDVGATYLVTDTPANDIVLKVGASTVISFPAASLKKGMLIYDDDGAQFLVWNGSAWTSLPEVAAEVSFDFVTDGAPTLFFHWMRAGEKRILLGELHREESDSTATYDDCFARVTSDDPSAEHIIEDAAVSVSIPVLGEAQTTVSTTAIASFPVSAMVQVDSSAVGFYDDTEGNAVFEIVFDEKTGTTPPSRYGVSSPGAFSVGWAPSYSVESEGVLLYVTSADVLFGEAFFMSPALETAYGQAIDFNEV